MAEESFGCEYNQRKWIDLQQCCLSSKQMEILGSRGRVGYAQTTLPANFKNRSTRPLEWSGPCPSFP
jgi:hypothetical protein